MADIDALLQEEDIEGLINVGAPKDEYSFEAEKISVALSEMDNDELKRENIVAVITLLWMQSFNLSQTDMIRRAPAIDRVVNRILNAQRTR